MTTRVAINGFGRIGRLVFRTLIGLRDDVDIVAINDVAELDNLAYLLRHDSVQQEPGARIEARGGEKLAWNDAEIRYLSVKDPSELPWSEMDVGIVVESSGLFTKREDAERHLEAGARRVIITAPAKGDVVTICPGVNDEAYDPQQHRVLSTASCTTNAVVPVAKVLNDRFGIVRSTLTTVHAYTNTQSLVDASAKKWRRGRAGAMNIVPSSTGAADATAKVLPELQGKLHGMAMRVPVPAGSIIDLVAQVEKPASVETVNAAFLEAAGGALQGILGTSDEPLVSSDIIGDPHSALVDLQSTAVVEEYLVKALAWYDNEWGYSRRVAEMALHVARLEEG